MLGRSNLDCFLDHTTPSVPCYYPTKTSVLGLDEELKLGNENGNVPFFNLGDFWKTFDEWSVYGAGVPLRLPCGETIIQYYVPYLSALQIYLYPGSTLLKRGHDISDCRDKSGVGDVSSDSDNENAKSLPRKSEQWDSSSCDSLERPSAECGDQADSQRELFFEYFERCSPYGRAPLSRKINELSMEFPYLYCLSSTQLFPTSWVSIAWYPIYRIPTGPTMNDLSTCFLTFHSLGTPYLQDLTTKFPPRDMAYCQIRESINEHFIHGECLLQKTDRSGHGLLGSNQTHKQEHSDLFYNNWKSTESLELPAFGLVSYKLRGPFWASAEPADELRATSLANSAGLWITKLGVKHPDFDFFTSRQW